MFWEHLSKILKCKESKWNLNVNTCSNSGESNFKGGRLLATFVAHHVTLQVNFEWKERVSRCSGCHFGPFAIQIHNFIFKYSTDDVFLILTESFTSSLINLQKALQGLVLGMIDWIWSSMIGSDIFTPSANIFTPYRYWKIWNSQKSWTLIHKLWIITSSDVLWRRVKIGYWPFKYPTECLWWFAYSCFVWNGFQGVRSAQKVQLLERNPYFWKKFGQWNHKFFD